VLAHAERLVNQGLAIVRSPRTRFFIRVQ
jgi:hypothetical protein